MSTNEDVEIGVRLKSIRDRKIWSQGKMASKLGVSLRAYQNYERGNRSVTKEVIRAVCSTFGVDVMWLLGGEEKREGVGDEGCGGHIAESFEGRLEAVSLATGYVMAAARRCDTKPNPDHLPRVVTFVYDARLSGALTNKLFDLLDSAKDEDFWVKGEIE